MEKFDIIIPHYKTGRMTAYSIAQILKYSDPSEINIIVVDNNQGDGSIEYLKPFRKHITIINYPKNLLQSHGVAFEYALSLGFVRAHYFLTLESDSYPTKTGWLDYYRKQIDDGYDSAGSILTLSGGAYMHPCGAMYSTQTWLEAKIFCEQTPYLYFPNMAVKEGFDCHLMVKDTIAEKFIESPEDYIELAKGYRPYSIAKAREKMLHYEPCTMPFHNGMGGNNESIHTYGERNVLTEVPSIFETKKKMLHRIGNEPGQWLYYFMVASGKRIFEIPTEVKWLPNRQGRQQEYTLMENGFKHLWAGTAFLDMKDTEMNDVYEIKNTTTIDLYDSLPDEQKIIST